MRSIVLSISNRNDCMLGNKYGFSPPKLLLILYARGNERQVGKEPSEPKITKFSNPITSCHFCAP